MFQISEFLVLPETEAESGKFGSKLELLFAEDLQHNVTGYKTLAAKSYRSAGGT